MTDEELTWLRSQFDRCAPWLQDALDRDAAGTHELEDVWQAIATGKAQLWPNEHSVIVTALDFFPRKIVLKYWLCGGDDDDYLKATPNIERWAADAGATVAAISGRRGWLRKLPGYREAGYSIIKDIS